GLAVMVIRGLSLLMGATSVWLVYRLTREAVPDQPPVWWLAAALVAFNPMFLFISAAVNNDNLITLTALASVWWLRQLMRQPDHLPTALALGLTLGCALLSKLTALGLLPLIAAGLSLASWAATGPWWPRRPSVVVVVARVMKAARCALPSAAVVYGLAAVISGWWYVRNWALYGEPTGVSMMLRIVNTRNPPPPIWELIVTEFEGFRLSFWALFGGVNILASPWVYVLFDALAVVATVGLVAAVVWRRHAIGRVDWWTMGLLLAWLAIVSIGLLRWSQMTLASQGRLLFPAVAGLAALWAIGLAAWAPARWRSAWAGVLSGALMAVAMILPFRDIAPVYAAPQPLSAERVAALPNRLDIDFGGVLRLVSAELPPGPARFNERTPITVTWQLTQPTDQDWSVYVHLFGRLDRKVGQFDTYPTLGALPTSRWRVGNVYQDVYPVLIEQFTEGPVLLRVEAGVYHFGTGKRLSASANGAPIGDSPIIGWIKLADPPVLDPPLRPVVANFNDEIAVEGVTISFARRFPPGDKRPQAFAVTTRLRGLARMTRDYTMFIHVVDAEGRVLSQWDAKPVENAYPTPFWDIGERLTDRREVVIPLPLPPEARMTLGFYDSATGQRAPRRDQPGDTLDLGPVADLRWI
ncbi:MAG: hypothetical protein NZ518_06430, partial [Dehalococcoidia bacterium]|nr:hypothetical protein [Dehalococcoidia bacterium]